MALGFVESEKVKGGDGDQTPDPTKTESASSIMVEEQRLVSFPANTGPGATTVTIMVSVSEHRKLVMVMPIRFGPG